MKLPNALTGIAPVAPDYDMLRAALALLQGATPTARCVAEAAVPFDRRTALHALVASDAAGFAAAAASLGHSFAVPRTAASHDVNEDERRLYRGVSTFVESGRVEAVATMRRAPWLQPRAADRG